MSAAFKTTTKLAGIAVQDKPREALSLVYRRILGILQEMPKDAAYRTHTEKIIQDRLTTVEEEEDYRKIEQKYNFQVEEMLLQAEKEFKCARKMMEYKVWEPLMKTAEHQWKWPVE